MKWIFEYTQAQEMSLFPKIMEGWQLVGRKNTEPTLSASMIAHDIFHHAPEDKGTFIEEIRSYGAEIWFTPDLDRMKVKNIISNIEPILEKTLEYFPLEKLVIPVYSPSFQNPDHHEMWLEVKDLLKEGLLNLVQEKQDLYEDEDLMALSKLAQESTWESYAHHVVDGYLKAKERWPNVRQAHKMYQEAEDWFKDFIRKVESPKLGTCVEVSLDRHTLTYQVQNSVVSSSIPQKRFKV